ncbi:MAG: hypothetical protein H6809_06160 [Phycisphaeraceae bacterium]|nr:hypothetical protein [Phycisphaeraceae bacterium]
MASNHSNPNHAAPSPSDEAMLAFVEGELGGPEEAALRRALARSPQVMLRLEAMRRERAVLRGVLLREPYIPASVQRRMERAVETGIERAKGRRSPSRSALEPAGAAPTGLAPDAHDVPLIHSIPIDRALPRRSWNSGGLGVGLATAAAIALVVGGVLATINIRPPTATNSAAPSIARGGGVAPASPDSLATASPRLAERTAGESGAPSVVAADALADPIAAASAPSLAGDPIVGVSEPGPSTRLLPGRVARTQVMALAEQRRLALRVSAPEPRNVIAAMEAAAGDADRPAWRVRTDAPATLAGSMGLTLAPWDEQATSPTSDTLATGPESVPGAPTRLAETPPADPDAWLLRPTDDALAVYLAEVDLTEAGLRTLERDLGRAAGGSSGFAALETSLDGVIGGPTLLVPAQDVIWWYDSPREWSKRALVPIVIERP